MDTTRFHTQEGRLEQGFWCADGKVVFEHNGFMHGDEEELEKAVAKAAGK